MKKTLYVLAMPVAIFLLISCSKKDDNEQIIPDPDPTPTALYREGGGVTDVDGNTYRSVIINVSVGKSANITEQEWMAENLKATHYENGTAINPGSLAMCNGDSSTILKLGYLYSWDAVMNNSTVAGAQGACPNGWHVPTVAEYDVLINGLGGASVASKKLKSTDTTYWLTTEFADNSSGFSALGGGWEMNGVFFHFKNCAEFWTSVEDGTKGRLVQIQGYENSLNNLYGGTKTMKNSCRCIKNQ